MCKRVVLAAAFFLLTCTAASAGDTIRLAIMPAEDPSREAAKYADFALYVHVHSTQVDDVQLRITKDFREAVELFQAGKVDGVFAGSFVAAVLIKKGAAKPVVRPVLTSGATTYRALVVAKAGAKPFGGVADLKGKRVAYCALASAGEIYVRGLLAPGERLEGVLTPVVTPTHQAALSALGAGEADYAVVKSLLWDPKKHEGLAVVGEDKAENPNNTLILATAAFEKHGAEIGRILVRLGDDTSFGALDIKKAMGAKGFIPTSVADFAPTFGLIEKARIDPLKFDFTF
jgi:ABC-type phosphate/phosphonate transport system substrate-binding protein